MSRDSYHLSEQVTLYTGDKIRVSGGPYYLTGDGKKIGIGEKGLFIFLASAKDGIFVRKPDELATRFLWMGDNKVDDITGIHRRRYKVSKLRAKPVARRNGNDSSSV